jgi:hypothetical protein
MKFKKILHPEIVLGRRGPLETIKYYKIAMESVLFKYGVGYYSNAMVNNLDANQSSHILMSWKFKQELPPVYHVGKDFSQALMKVDKSIPLDRLPERFFGYFSFVEDTIHDGENFVQGAYVFIGDSRETDIKANQYGGRSVWMITLGNQSGMSVPVSRLLVSLACPCCDGKEHTSRKMSEMIEGLPTNDFSPEGNRLGEVTPSIADSRSAVSRLLINLVLYIHSMEPDVQRLPVERHLSLKRQKQRENQNGNVNLCTLPVTLISWNYNRPVQYTKDSTWVETHMRWQRCGIGNTQIRLIWVEAHKRQFKKEDPSHCTAE